jgi:uncharacterized protein
MIMNRSNLISRSVPFLLLLVGLLAFFVPSIGQKYPAAANPPRLVNDFAHVMTPGEVAQLEAKLNDFNTETSNQISIVTIKTLDGADPMEYATGLGEAWGIGNKKKDNGVLILAAIDDHQLAISTGYGLEGALPDIITARIRENEMNPSFKEGNFYEGFDKGTSAIMMATKGEYTAEPTEQQPRKRKGSSLATIMVIMVAIIIFFLRGGGRGGGGSYMSGRGHRSGLGSAILGGIIGSSLGRGGWSGGGGSSWGGGSSSGGGFGGFGGGSFGGGGSSGSW